MSWAFGSSWGHTIPLQVQGSNISAFSDTLLVQALAPQSVPGNLTLHRTTGAERECAATAHLMGLLLPAHCLGLVAERASEQFQDTFVFLGISKVFLGRQGSKHQEGLKAEWGSILVVCQFMIIGFF